MLFGVDANTVAADFGSWLEQHGAALQGGDQHIVLAGAGAEITFDAANAPDPLAVGTTAWWSLTLALSQTCPASTVSGAVTPQMEAAAST